ncbi:TfoX/Sxy family protein [Variovorax sp. J22R24]|uniref:TfoX/Sxy family protein n=1 Tax=Variovorax gracilis TaxID=3053502 RepID=UPI002576CA00|nr:TfoX/Sxy family protein [Variovorax sp. J22R24]MDM0109690.1 TfoX/Sxy family protein [Variovorax sp. J22R24]
MGTMRLADELPEVFERFGRVSARRMFGGHGIFHEGRMFGLVSGERLYLKTDEESRAKFEARGLAPFEYMRAGKLTPTSYVEAPAEIYEDREEAARWARLAWEAVVRRDGAAARQKPAARKIAATKAPRKKPAAKKAAVAKAATTNRSGAKR